MRVPNLDVKELTDAYGMNSEEMQHYLNVQTGEVVMLMGSTLYDSDEDRELAEEIEDNDELYRLVPSIDSPEAFQLMENFVETVADEEAAKALDTALQMRRPFRHFKDALYDFPEVQERWYEFEAKAHRQAVLDWLKREDIEVDGGQSV